MTTLLNLASEEGGTFRIASLPDGRLEIRSTSVVNGANIITSNLDRPSAVMVRDAINRWLAQTTTTEGTPS